jgi:hypothetical protein
MLIPRWTESALSCVGSVCLIGVNRDDSKRVWQTENFALDEGIGSEDCVLWQIEVS